MRHRRPSTVCTAIVLFTALAVAIPTANAGRGQSGQQRKAAAQKKKKGSGDRLRGVGRQTGHGQTGAHHGVGPGTSNVFARKGPSARGGVASSRRVGPRVATASASRSSTTMKKSRKPTTRKSTKRKTTTKRMQKRPVRVGPRNAAAAQAAEQRQAADFDAPEMDSRRAGVGELDEADQQGFDDGFGGEPQKRGLSSGVKKAFKVLGMGVLAVGIGAVFVAGGAPLAALSVPVMMFAIGAGQIIAKPEIDPNQMMVPPGMGQDDFDPQQTMSPQERYRYLARDMAAGGNLPGGLPSQNGLNGPPGAPQFGTIGVNNN